MRRRAIAVLLLAACAPDADAPIFLSGVARDAAGAPIAGLRVDLAASLRDKMGPSLLGENWSPVASATTDDDGRYTLTVRAGVLRPGDGSRQTMRVSTSALDDVLFTASFDAELPALEPWTAGLQISDGLVSFMPAPQRADETKPLHALELVSGNEVLWRMPVDGAPTVPLPNIPTEDAPEPRWRLRAWRDGARSYAPVRANAASVEWSARTVSESLPAARDDVIPPSRGQPCSVDGRPLDDCPVTDGSLQPVALPLGDVEPVGIAIALATPRLVSRVVIRGLRSWRTDVLVVEGITSSGATVELARSAVGFDTSSTPQLRLIDGVGFEQWIDLPLDSAEPVAQVVIRGTEEERPAMLAAVREISVF